MIPVDSIFPPAQHIGESLSSVGFRERIIGSYWLIGTNFQFVMDNEKVLEMERGDNCTTVWMYLMPPNYA